MNRQKFLPALLLAILPSLTSVCASEVSSNLWQLTKHVEDNGALTITARMFDLKNPPPGYNRNAPGGWDDHNYERDLEAPAQLIFQSPDHGSVGMKYTAGYYRGPIYSVKGSPSQFLQSETNKAKFVSIFSSSDQSELIVAVDHGLIFTSTNFGMTWTVISDPGRHHFPLSTAADGSGFYAQAFIEESSSKSIDARSKANTGWYAVAASATESKIVISADASQPAPMLSIRYSSTGVTIAWPANFAGFTLEETIGPDDGSWTPVTNTVEIVGQENQVTLPPAMGDDFFRLRR